MARKKKTDVATDVVKEEVATAEVVENPTTITVKPENVKTTLSFPTGKKPQRKHSLKTNPASKQYDAKVAKRRAKEKARRKAARRNHK